VAQTITYGDLVAQLPIAIEPNDPRLSKLLDEISRQEFAEGRGFCLFWLFINKAI